MAQQYVTNHAGLLVPAWFPIVPDVPITYANRTVDAAGESFFGIGYLMWSDGPGSSHVVSGAGGGKVFWIAGTGNVFSNAGSTLRVGIQSVSSGLEAGSFDTYKDLIGGTDTITSSALMTTTLASGTKTIAWGDKVAIGMEMTSRGGADAVNARSVANISCNNPYTSADTGSGPTRSSTMPMFAIKADDGTVGWLLGAPVPYTDDTVSFSDTTTPDEISLIVTTPAYPQTARILCAWVSSMASGDNIDWKLYTTPLGTPSLVASGSSLGIDTSANANPGLVYGLLSANYDLLPSTQYALSLRATGTTLALSRMTLPDAALRAALPYGPNVSYGVRTNDTGAFTETTTIVPRIGFNALRFADDAGAGGSSGGGMLVGSRLVSA